MTPRLVGGHLRIVCADKKWHGHKPFVIDDVYPTPLREFLGDEEGWYDERTIPDLTVWMPLQRTVRRFLVQDGQGRPLGYDALNPSADRRWIQSGIPGLSLLCPKCGFGVPPRKADMVLLWQIFDQLVTAGVSTVSLQGVAGRLR